MKNIKIIYDSITGVSATEERIKGSYRKGMNLSKVFNVLKF